MDFLEGEGGAEEILGEALPTFEVARADGGRVTMNVEAAVFPGEEVGELCLADELGAVQGVEEAGAEEVGGDPFCGLAGAALMASGADVAGFAGKGEEALVATVMALVAGEAGGEVATSVVGLDGGDGFRVEGSHGGAVVAPVRGEEVIPCGVDDLPERGGAGAAGLVNGRHNCSLEQLWRRNVGFSVLRCRGYLIQKMPSTFFSGCCWLWRRT